MALEIINDILAKVSIQSDDVLINDGVNPFLEMPSIESTILLICDIEQDNNQLNKNMKSMIINSQYIIQSCLVFEIPLIFSFNNDRNMCSDIVKLIDDTKQNDTNRNLYVCKKTSFSMLKDSNIAQILQKMGENNGKNNVIIIGSNKQNAVLETVIDLRNNGYIVHVVMDCMDIFDSKQIDIVCNKLLQIGSNITTVQSIVYQLMKDKNHAKFKSILPLTKHNINALNQL
eukprot:382178_1